MARKVKTIFLTSVFVFLISMLTLGYYFFTKKNVSLKNMPATAVNAGQLYSAYISDSAGAQKKYTGHIVEVYGQVAGMGLNQQQQEIILLKSGSVSAYVNCTMDAACSHFKLQDRVRVKGLCAGIGESEKELGIMADVYLTNCYIVN